MVELRQRQELRKLLIPELNQSLQILSLPLLDLKTAIQEELLNNPLLEELPAKVRSTEQIPAYIGDLEFRKNLITNRLSLQDVLLRQLGMFTNSDEDYKIGFEIIGNIDENGYLKASLDEISSSLNCDLSKIQEILALIQCFEPAGVAARTVVECLLIQLELANEKDPLLKELVTRHLDDIAKKNYSHIAKSLQRTREEIEPLIKAILRLDPKPGRNYSTEETQHVTPDIVIYDKQDEFEITINDEDIPTLNINKDYKQMLKNEDLDAKTKEFLSSKLKNALVLMRSVFRRKATLRRITEVLTEIQGEAIRHNLSFLKPLTFQEVAKILNIHESTVCRAIMNKYVRLPYGVVALKEFFSSSIKDSNGESHSSTSIKGQIKELIQKENKKHPLSDKKIADILKLDKNLNISRRTITKYREELKILSSPFRRER